MPSIRGRLLALLDRWVLSTAMTAMYAPRRPSEGRDAWLSELCDFVDALDEEELLPALTPMDVRLVREVPERPPAHAFVIRGAVAKVPAWSSLRLPRAPSQFATLLCEAPTRHTVVVMLHSWWQGWWTLSRRAWPVGELLAAGHAVAMPILPGHASRRTAGRWPVPQFPGRNPLVNLLTVADTVLELRQLIGWLIGRGYERVQVAGSSLGGYFAALLATVEPRIGGLALDRPLVGLEGLSGVAGLAGLYRRLSPFARPLAIPAHRVAVAVGRYDALTTLQATATLCRHFGVEPLVTEESHLVGPARRMWMAQVLKAFCSETAGFHPDRIVSPG